MPKKRSIATKLTGAGVAGVAAAMVLGTAPAHADGAEVQPQGELGSQGSTAQQDWLDDPIVVPNPQTSVSYQFHRGTAQVRFGTYNGTQYGWGRAIGASGSDWVLFEVDTDGDRSGDLASYAHIGERIYTYGYPTSSSGNRAFRACIVNQPGDSCSSGNNGTYWW
ncbi:hypothetical protein FHX37_4118 [Haloactinospora alba]|uniref:Secreted protein n=1 Tax=Haloactinospora alba TaxID=405555 RepID=A0A543NA85_9ACTN|nr:hypothetical protein [Haloactinospora alba]TQN28754.1 hypothetical protein FHX37_4118 [Haloactinospora alba]